MKIEIIESTVLSHGGPHHPGCGHWIDEDEREEMEQEVWEQAKVAEQGRRA